MTFKQSVAIILISTSTVVASVWGYEKYKQQHKLSFGLPAFSSVLKKSNSYDGSGSMPMVDFEKAATKAAPAVVHIKVLLRAKQVANSDMQNNPFKDFFGDGGEEQQQSAPQQRASGSGVAITGDGYIVTNNHVVEDADEVMVTLNNKNDYKAKVIGKDPSSDLAVIKIDAENLPYLTFANSDDVHLGQWVLAIGYPLNLETTVTSGIVSAKARNIGINSRKSDAPIESFIQTDAAVNPGNSGGALVNANGDVIGINSAIASPTGSYAGYSYAIPSNLVQRVATDIIKYGSSKRAYLGVMFGSDQMSEEDRQKNNVKEGEGVFVMDVAKGSAADEAGLQKGDFITKINGTVVKTGTEMVGKISALRPGDKINITYTHDGTEKTTSATLKGSSGDYANSDVLPANQLGASFETLDESKAAELHLESGVVVTKLTAGIITDQTKIREGFIITKINNQTVGSVEELQAALKNAGNSAIISGVYPDQPGSEYQYALNDLNSVK